MKAVRWNDTAGETLGGCSQTASSQGIVPSALGVAARARTADRRRARCSGPAGSRTRRASRPRRRDSRCAPPPRASPRRRTARATARRWIVGSSRRRPPGTSRARAARARAASPSSSTTVTAPTTIPTSSLPTTPASAAPSRGWHSRRSSPRRRPRPRAPPSAAARCRSSAGSASARRRVVEPGARSECEVRARRTRAVAGEQASTISTRLAASALSGERGVEPEPVEPCPRGDPEIARPSEARSSAAACPAARPDAGSWG